MKSSSALLVCFALFISLVSCEVKEDTRKLAWFTIAETRASMQSRDFERVRVFTFHSPDSLPRRIRSEAELDSSKYDFIYNLVLKDERVIAFVLIPFVESGDRRITCSYYFGDDDKTIALRQGISFFDEACSDGVVLKTYTAYFDSNGSTISDSTSLTNSEGLAIQKGECSQSGNYSCLEITSVETIPFIANMIK